MYTVGQTVSNLTAQSDGDITLYAVWKSRIFDIDEKGVLKGVCLDYVLDVEFRDMVEIREVNSWARPS